jgi:hypothetical protein
MEDIYVDKSASRFGEQLFNRAAFAPAALGTYGNMGFNTVPGLGTWALDAALSRQFNLGEDRRVEFRAEAFNLPNAVRPNNPATSITSNNFGRITSILEPRIMQFALKYLF